MLILIEQIYRVGADSEPELRKIGIDPHAIDSALPYSDPSGVEGTKIFIQGVHVYACTNSVEEIVQMTQEATWGPPKCDQGDSDTGA